MIQANKQVQISGIDGWIIRAQEALVAHRRDCFRGMSVREGFLEAVTSDEQRSQRSGLRKLTEGYCWKYVSRRW